MARTKIRVAVLYGGRSGEHEVSLISAASVIRNLDPERFEVIPIAIDKEGRWHLNDLKLLQGAGRALPVYKDAPEVVLPPNPGSGAKSFALLKGAGQASPSTFDVIFPVMHGPLCEDGTIQGLMELADVAYVGCGVAASAVGMDKDMAKRLIRDAGLPIVPYLAVTAGQYARGARAVESQVAQDLGFPCFVKPSNMGSSVGVHKVKSASELGAALKDAFKYDTKVLIEEAISAREIEVSVLEGKQFGDPPRVSVPGEINPTHEFYSYEAKYLDENGAELLIPARLSAEQTREAQRIAGSVFEALCCEGMARVDMFLDRDSGKFYVNEINTIPGFTHISMYPKMWEATGLKYKELLSELIELALARHERKQKLSREYLPE